MTNFYNYLEEAKNAVEQKYGVMVSLFLGEYTPDIDNFYFHYYFIAGEPAAVMPPTYKVTVNTWWDNGPQHRLLVRKCPSPSNTCLEAIFEPITLTLTEAYELARPYNPDLYYAVVFLENSGRLNSGAGYWFMINNDSNQWIFVSLRGDVTITELQPCTY